MAKSYIEQKMEMMHRLLWTNILRQWVEMALWTIPYIGPFLKLPVIDDIVMWAIETYLEKPLFLILTRWGVFTTVDWQETKIYNEYEKQAEKLVKAQENPTWDPKDRGEFRNAARALIRFNIRIGS